MRSNHEPFVEETVPASSVAAFIETVALREGVPQLIDRHRKRMERTLRDHALEQLSLPDLASLCPTSLRRGLTKCRIVYREQIEQITFDAYRPRTIRRLALMELPPHYNYRYKSTERTILEQLRSIAEADEVILVNAEGAITDSSYTNLLFLRDGRYYTPSTPLLAGVQREYLLTTGQIEECAIRREDLRRYSHVGLINAMMPLEAMPLIPMEQVDG